MGNSMMSKYCELIDSHIETMKRMHKEKQRKTEPASQRFQLDDAPAAMTPMSHPSDEAEPPAPQGVSLRSRLLSFGSQESPQFARFWNDGGTIHTNNQPAFDAPSKRGHQEIQVLTHCKGKPLRHQKTKSTRWSSATPVYSPSHTLSF